MQRTTVVSKNVNFGPTNPGLPYRDISTGGGGCTHILGQYVYVPPDPPPPTTPHLPAWTAPKDPHPLLKIYILFVPLFRPGLLQKTPFENMRFFVILVPKSPRFSVRGRSESPPFSVRGRSLSPNFQTLGGTYTDTSSTNSKIIESRTQPTYF